MKLGFVFDTRFIKYNDNYYSTNLSAEVLSERYLNVFDNMVVVGRYKQARENPAGKLVQSSSEKIEFKCVHDENPIKRVFHFGRENQYIESALSDCDAVICRGWRGTGICRKLRKKYLVEVVNCTWDSYWNHGLIGKVVAPIMFIIRRITTKNAPFVLYVTHEFLQRRYPTKGKSVAVSDVALDKFNNDIIEKRINKIETKSQDEKIIIGTAAAIDVPFKGQRFVISALAKLKAQGINNFEYQMVGSGNNEQLKKLAEEKGVADKVVFLGSIVHDKMFAWYDSIDVYIQPSLQEGLPRAMIEAMSRGLPCYGTRTGGIPELIDNECVCSSNRFIAKKLARFLSNYQKEIALKYAVRNYNESRKYAADILEKKRYDFFHDFAESNVGYNND